MGQIEPKEIEKKKEIMVYLYKKLYGHKYLELILFLFLQLLINFKS